jgi:hypothetical protein
MQRAATRTLAQRFGPRVSRRFDHDGSVRGCTEAFECGRRQDGAAHAVGDRSHRILLSAKREKTKEERAEGEKLRTTEQELREIGTELASLRARIDRRAA